MIITLKYACGCEWDFPEISTLEKNEAARTDEECPYHRKDVTFDWCHVDAAMGHIRLVLREGDKVSTTNGIGIVMSNSGRNPHGCVGDNPPPTRATEAK